MTIETRVETAASAKEVGFQFVRASDVAVLSVTGRRPAPDVALTTLLHACVARFEPFLLAWRCVLPPHHVLLFLSTPFWEQHNVVSRHRGIWRQPNPSWLSDGLVRSPGVEITGEVGSRFAGIARIEMDSLLEAAEFVRTHRASFLFLSLRGDHPEEWVRAVFKNVFPEGESTVDWTSVVNRLGEDLDVCMRVSGGFDDRDVSIDAFLRIEHFRQLGHASP